MLAELLDQPLSEEQLIRAVMRLLGEPERWRAKELIRMLRNPGMEELPGVRLGDWRAHWPFVEEGKAWDPVEHPRGPDGRFIRIPGGTGDWLDDLTTWDRRSPYRRKRGTREIQKMISEINGSPGFQERMRYMLEVIGSLHGVRDEPEGPGEWRIPVNEIPIEYSDEVEGGLRGGGYKQTMVPDPLPEGAHPVEVNPQVIEVASPEGLITELFPDMANQPPLALTHEIGHYLDTTVLSDRDKDTPRSNADVFASFRGADEADEDVFDDPKREAMANVMEAIGRSQHFRTLAYALQTGMMLQLTPEQAREGIPALIDRGEDVRVRDLSMTDMEFVDYLTSPPEAFARAYAQWVATETQEPSLTRQIDVRANDPVIPDQWSDEEFLPIRDAFRRLFEVHGLTSPVPSEHE